MNLDKLVPAPWEVFGGKDAHGFPEYVGENEFWCRNTAAGWDTTLMDRNHAEFIAMARNAFDVMMRRGWYPVCDSEKWMVEGEGAGIVGKEMGKNNTSWPVWSDPFTALVEADRWYKENVEHA